MSQALSLEAPLVLRLVERFLGQHPDEAARALERLEPDEIARILAQASSAAAASVLRRLGTDDAARVLSRLPREGAAGVLAELDPSRTAGLLARLDDEDRAALVALLPPPVAHAIEQLLEFPPGTAGALMDTRVTSFAPGTRVDSALAVIQRLRDRRIADIMLIDPDGRLVGAVSLQDLVGAPPEQALEDLARQQVVFVHPMTRRDELVDLLQQHKVASLPVVDLQGRLIGILRQSTLLDAAQQDAIADLQQMVGVSREEQALSGPWLAVRTRLPWLHINLLTAFAASAVVGMFESTIARFTALAVLMPVVAGQSGNTGAQAMAVTIRGLALREIRAFHWWRVARKELAVGLINGVVIALVTAAGVWVWSGTPGLAAVIGLSMVTSMCIAAVAGASVPILLAALKRDPATASSIILTTITDIVGFSSFLGLATALSALLVPG
ncbi:MAG TPA: magnesium transporter [Kofleriaceae bacterium]|nr:magnesium transporter [Kofleriaceae bacterium]